MLFSELRRQKYFRLKHISYKIGSGSSPESLGIHPRVKSPGSSYTQPRVKSLRSSQTGLYPHSGHPTRGCIPRERSCDTQILSLVTTSRGSRRCVAGEGYGLIHCTHALSRHYCDPALQGYLARKKQPPPRTLQ